MSAPQPGRRPGGIRLALDRSRAHVDRCMNAPPKTLLQIVGSTTDYLAKHGIESPRLNAEHLVAHALGKKRLDLYLEFDRPLGEAELGPIRELLKKRGQRVPLQHLLGTVEFTGRVFGCDARALIPRPETEQFVELVIERVKASPPTRILDVGTGSGVLALTLAAAFPEASVEACDVSAEALTLARENAARLNLAERVTFIESDLMAALAGPYDLIVANLPYIPSGELEGLAAEVQHDPRSALDGGGDGLVLIDRLLAEAIDRLSPGGLIALEIHHDQSAVVLARASELGYKDYSAAVDYHGINRFIFAYYG